MSVYALVSIALALILLAPAVAPAVDMRLPSPAERVHVEVQMPPGYVIIEGDMQVREEEAEDIRMGKKATYEADLWPNNTVPYRFDANMSNADMTDALNAMQDWEDVSALNFVLRTSQSAFIHIRNSDSDSTPGCSSPVGRQGNQQIINVTTNCLGSFSIHHELGHSLGYRHEQSRADRDDFVTINWCNIEGSTACGPNSSGRASNFQIASSSDAYGPYDFDSVMHYGDDFFDACGTMTCGDPVTCPTTGGCTTIDVDPPNTAMWQNAIGQRDHLSVWDQKVMGFLYPPTNWRFQDDAYSGSSSGTFIRPYKGTLSAAINATPTGGTLVIKTGANYPAMTITKAITLRAPLGGVVID